MCGIRLTIYPGTLGLTFLRYPPYRNSCWDPARKDSGDTCFTRAKKRTRCVCLLKRIRAELNKSLTDARGVDYGMTIGLTSDGIDVDWLDVMLVTRDSTGAHISRGRGYRIFRRVRFSAPCYRFKDAQAGAGFMSPRLRGIVPMDKQSIDRTV